MVVRAGLNSTCGPKIFERFLAAASEGSGIPVLVGWRQKYSTNAYFF
jgi:hypothetical protein